jgi:2-polyprenyl-3-methyl-5-hydroxy-6-metoxy-1,4-benzoquinol methylase
VNSDDSGHELRTTFDLEAERYDRVRPAPPTALVDAMLEQGQLKAGDRILEVGCGTGQATRPLAERGLKVHALELGPELATLARRNLAGFSNVTVTPSLSSYSELMNRSTRSCLCRRFTGLGRSVALNWPPQLCAREVCCC